jgi:hypothetical protein
MTAFSKSQFPVPGIGHIHTYVGIPDCRAFYGWILDSLIEMTHPGFEAPNPPLKKIETGQKGNLGEAITVLIGKTDRFSAAPFVCALGGALTPFSAGTQIGLDITIVYLDPNGTVANDRLFIQEVKTTGKADLAYSKALIDDYKKLLDTTVPALSLMSRVSALMAKLKWEHNFPAEKLKRVEDLAQVTAADCTRVRLLPTLVHDRGSDPALAMSHVMTEIGKQGWAPGCIEAWSISLSKLDEALVHMANRRRFP